MAIAFAGGILNSQLPALSENKAESKNRVESAESVIQRIKSNTESTPEFRAYNLLLIASRLLEGQRKTEVTAQFNPASTEQSWHYRRPERWEFFLVSFAQRVATNGDYLNQANQEKAQAYPDSKSIPADNIALADTAIRAALTLLDKSHAKFAKLNLYFIASQLFEKTKNADGMRKCCKVMADAFQSCEGDSPADAEQIKACSSVLNSMAYGLIAVQIPDFNPKDSIAVSNQTQVKPFSDKDFNASEKLKLRALAMVDRLDSNNHVRRKGHRDLALWYIQLGKNELAERQKQTLFELVGFKDDSVLYPQHEGCGSFVWWKKEKLQGGFDCGMG